MTKTHTEAEKSQIVDDSSNYKHDASENVEPHAGRNTDTELSNTSASSYGQNNGSNILYLSGARFWLIFACIGLGLFLTSLEIPIVTTSLVAITNDFGEFNNVGWVISSYLLGYVGVLVIWAKLSDIYGRKSTMCISVAMFIIFSGACGASQTMVQLIVLRAFQGMGGSGVYAIATAMLTELVPPEKLAKHVANLSSVYAISLLAGPIIGGAISQSSSSSWRWVFLLNVPAYIPGLVCLFFAVPNGFPYHGQTESSEQAPTKLTTKEKAAKLDLLGAALLLVATLSLSAGFQQAGVQFPWKSAYVITLLTISGFLWIGLLLWERHITNHGIMEPVLPWRFLYNRFMLGLLLNALLLGGPFFVTVFQLPQRFQLVHGSSAIRAGIQTMPFTFASPFGSLTASTLAKKKLPIVYVILIGTILQTIGFALLASLLKSTHVIDGTYGFQFIAGFGCGMNISTLILAVPFVVENRDKAVGMGAVTQLRLMGGAIVLAIATSVFNTYTKPRLAHFMGGLKAIDGAIYSAQSLSSLPVHDRAEIRNILAHGYDLQMWVLCAFAAAQIPAALLLWRKQQIRV